MGVSPDPKNNKLFGIIKKRSSIKIKFIFLSFLPFKFIFNMYGRIKTQNINDPIMFNINVHSDL
jgi:hypothetical protein